MYLLTQDLPSGYNYSFPSIEIKPMTFAQILEYLEAVPAKPVEKYYFDYCVVKDDDPNIESLLICDLDYVIFFKKAITISDNLELNSTIKCPRCGNSIRLRTRLSDIEFNKIDSDSLNGLSVKFGGEFCDVELPTVEKFMKIFSKYRLYKKVTDMRIIKLISLFKDTDMYLQKYETKVVNATHKDITVLAMLEDIYLNVVKPIKCTCSNCYKDFKLNESQLDLPEEKVEELRSNYGGVTVGIESLAVDFFRDIYENNQLTADEVYIREIRQDTQS